MTSTPEFKLQFDPKEISRLAKAFSYDTLIDEDRFTSEIKPRVAERGYVPYEDFLLICEWKTQRSKSRVKTNSAALVEEATRLAFSAKDEKLRIEILTLLNGVEYPTASVLLHFLHTDPYPILDIRALEALGVDKPSIYHFGFWWSYTTFCRDMAKVQGVDMRTLDRALWQWSAKETNRR